MEITASRSGGAGGQHVNKTSTKITLRWNVLNTVALTQEQKERVFEKLAHKLTSEGDLIIHSSSSRSQHQNKEAALKRLADEIRYGLYVPKKRMKTRVAQHKKEARLESKSRHSLIKKTRSKKIDYD